MPIRMDMDGYGSINMIREMVLRVNGKWCCLMGDHRNVKLKMEERRKDFCVLGGM